MSYFGSYNHQLDQKNRLRIPAKLKAELGENFVIVRGVENCLYIYSSEQFSQLYGQKAQAISAVKNDDKLARIALRQIMKTMDIPEEDNQGRFILKADLRERVSIKKDVVFVGMLDRIELWAKDVYEASTSDLSAEEYDDALQALGAFGI